MSQIIVFKKENKYLNNVINDFYDFLIYFGQNQLICRVNFKIINEFFIT